MHKFALSAALLLSYLPAFAVDGFNMPGLDYANFKADTSFICRDSCEGDTRCQGWTWVRPGIQGPSGLCWLKSSFRSWSMTIAAARAREISFPKVKWKR